MDSIAKYFRYISEFPNYFVSNRYIKIIMEKDEIENYILETKDKVGVVYENKYFAVIVDLVEDLSGKKQTYTRIINKNKYNGVLIIPVYKDKLVLLRQFRHGTREFELEFPRGFSEQNLSIEENARKEIFEELGANVKKIVNIGSVISDSGLSGGLVHMFLCELEDVGLLCKDEGIEDYQLLTIKDIKSLIQQNKIRDGFTLSAICKIILGEKICFQTNLIL
ncbi:MAG: NUDIX hydrolase [Pelosinus sp.]|nr:NUDIX hydrolase [Pelosinus sp.]